MVGESSDDDVQRESQFADYLIFSLILTIYRMILKHRQNGSLNFEGLLHFGTAQWPAEETYDDEVRTAVVEALFGMHTLALFP